MKKTHLLFFAPFLFLVACNSPVVPDTGSLHEATILDHIDYEVIQTVIDSLCSNDPLVHIMQITHSDSADTATWTYYFDQIELDGTELIANYAAKNTTVQYLDPNQVNDPADLFSLEQFAYYFASSNSEMGYTGYYNDYPSSSGIISLHRPGVNADTTCAVLELLFMHGNLSAESYLLVLEKIDGQWELAWNILMDQS